MTPERIKHFELIQNIITRMNTNSFQIKSFSIAVITALLAVYAKTLIFWMIPIGYPTILIFWIIDSFYLQHERKFRGLYNDLVNDKETSIKTFDMNISKYRNGDYSLLFSMFISINSFIYITLIAFFTILVCVIK
jgi:hypothetical protein